MNIVLSLDYELFFGSHTGTVERTLLQPSQAIFELAGRHGIPLAFFVDAGFLLRLRKEGHRSPALMHDYDRVMRQLEQLVAAGHEIHLHVHPHWEDSCWNGHSWVIDTRRYRLHDFGVAEMREVATSYADALRAITGGEGVFAYRAGGWVIQPFSRIREAIRAAGIRIDSTVFAGGRSDEASRGFDFSAAPVASHWFFDDDPLVARPDGEFLEVPIASLSVSPDFYWRMAMATRLGSQRHRPIGDGSVMPLSRADLLAKLTRRTVSTVSMDGYKAGLLPEACRRYERAGMADLVVIGHPKMASSYSLQQLERFVLERGAGEFVGYGVYQSLFANRQDTPHAWQSSTARQDLAIKRPTATIG